MLSQDLTPLQETNGFPRPVQNVFELQLALAREHLCPGSIDGALGAQTRAALRAFQLQRGLLPNGNLDETNLSRITLQSAPYTDYLVTTNDFAQLQKLSPTWLGKSQQSALDYETLLEALAERAHSHPNLLRRLNPGFDWSHAPANALVHLPDIPDESESSPPPKAAFIRIFLSARALEVFDSATNLLAHFPCSIASNVEKRPAGELHVSTVVPNPNYTFDPAVFPESAEAHELNRKLVLPPGPNNPVGRAWIGLDKPGYGIHGTPNPEQVGRTTSHGCFRLANWNALYLLRLVWVGMPVYVLR